MKTPLAWLSLVHDRRRLAGSVLGVSFAVLLMFVEMGFLNGVYDSSARPVAAMAADLVLVSRLKDDMNLVKPFHRGRLLQAAQHPQVVSAHPLYLVAGTWRSVGARRVYPIRVFAFDLTKPVFDLPDVDAALDRLQAADTALVDRRGRSTLAGLRQGMEGEVHGRRVRLVGDFELGPDLELNGSLMMSDRNMTRLLFDPHSGLPNRDRVELGLLTLTPGARVDAVKQELRRRLEEDVDVLTKAELIERVKDYWRQNRPVGAVFGMGLLVGFLIGVMICYQVLFTDISDHLAELATLKAIGYEPSYLVGLALRQGTYLALLAFVIGLPSSALAYLVLERVTGLEIGLTAGRIFVVLALALGMCLVAALLAIGRVLRADPAEVY